MNKMEKNQNEQKMECDVVRNLLPSYNEKLTSEATNYMIREHLKSCEDCKKIQDYLKEKMDDRIPEMNDYSRVLNKTKSYTVLKGIFLLLALLGIFVSAIVDVAINGKFTWSFIVTGGIVLIYTFILLIVYSNKNKLIKAFASTTILLLPYLKLIDFISYHDLGAKSEWFWQYGIWFALMWLVVCWCGILGWKLFKNKIYMGLCITSLLAIPASLITNKMVNDYTSNLELLKSNVLNLIICGGLTILFGILAAKSSKRE